MPPALRPGGATPAAIGNTSPKSVKTAHWFQPELDALRWDRSFPYQLMCVRRGKGGAWVQDPKWQFILPIPPSSFRMLMQPPSELIVNQLGVVEVTDEVRVFSWQMAGTTGMLPLRPAAPVRSQSSIPIFAGTVAAAQNTAQSARTLVNNLNGNPQPGPILQDRELQIVTAVGRTTGYAQFLLLRQFIVRYYAAKKKDPSLQLALAVWKTKDVYLVKLSGFDLTRSVPRVHHWDYSLSGETWGSISIDKSQSTVSSPRSPASPSKLAVALQALRDSRQVLSAASGTVTAAVGDFDALVQTPLREVSLMVSDAAGAATALADFPRGILMACRGAVLSALSLRDHTGAIPRSVLDRLAAAGDEVDQLRALGAQLSRSDTRSATLVLSGPLLNSPALDIFERPDEHYAFFAALRPGDLQLPPQVLSAMAQERRRASSLRRPDLEARRALVQLASDRLAKVVGLGGPLATVAPARAATDADLEVLFSLNQAAMTIDSLAADAPEGATPTEDAMRFVSGLSSQAGVPFPVSQAKRSVPYPFGCTLEQVAERYLGDPDRWMELATLNQLDAPYVDEVGYRLELLAQPDGARAVVGTGGSKLRVNQAVSVLSRTASEVQTRVQRVEPYGATWLVTLGVDCSRFHTSDGAYLHAYSAGTVHAGQSLWVPSDEEPAEDDSTLRDPRATTDADPLARTSGADLLLTSEGDLVVTPDGDFRYARGLALVTQVVREVVGTPRGSKLRHPSYGLPEAVGETVGDLDASELGRAVREAFADDPLFASVDAVAVRQDGGTTKVGVSVSVGGVDRPLGLEVELA